MSAPAPTARFGFAFAIVASGLFLSVLDLFIVNVAFPSIGADFSATSVAGLSWILNGYTIVFAALLVPAGKLADLVGRRRVFVGGLLVFAAGSLLCALAPSVEALVAARVLQAVGAAAVTPTSLGLLLPLVPPTRRAAMIGAWGSIGAVGAAAGPPLGGLLVEASWHWIFVVNIPVALVAAAAAVRVLPEIRDPAQARLPDLAGTGLLVAAVALAVLGLVQAPEWNWDVRVWATFAAAAAAAAVLVARSRRHPAPALEPEVVRSPGFALGAGAASLFFLAMATMLLGNVLFLTDVWGWSALRSGLGLAPGAVLAAALAPVAGRAIPRVGAGAVGAVGATMFALSGAWSVWQVGTQPEYATAFLPAMLVGGAGVGLALAATTVAAVSGMPPVRLATGIGALMTFRQVAGALGVAGLIAILDPTSGATPTLAAFNDGRWLMVGASASSAVLLLGLHIARARQRTAARAGRPVEAVAA